PLLQFTFIKEKQEPLQAIEMIGVVQSADIFIDEISTRETGLFSAGEVLATGYFICSVLLLSTLLLSVFKIAMLLQSHQKKKIAAITFIETSGVKGTPFSFLHYIFWNNAIDVNSAEGRQIFQHELVHVKEKHTLDKLFLQLTLSVFWLNPFFWLMRRELRMIHEFIADQKSVHDKDSSKLAAMILQTAYPGHFNGISNAFFQSSIKRRLLMLTQNQNPKLSYISRLLAVPIMAITVMAFTFKTQPVETISNKKFSPITVVIDAGHGKMDNGQYNGARVGDVYEDQITLAIAKKIEELNKNKAIKIVLTRSTEATTEIAKRVEVAAREGAALFLSVHVGANENNTNRSGMEVYVSSKNTGQNLQSELFGSALVNELQSVYKTNPDLIKRPTGVWVIDKNVCPAVLIECGYLT
ncbi:MAG: N-acetylmuramoyl-L-alanine amidase, partial [Bacteroidota bacterium]